MSEPKFIQVPDLVFPSNEPTIEVMQDDEYGGAHYYMVQNCRGFNNGKTEYDNTFTILEFVKKEVDGTIEAGLQSEQLAIILMDRAKKLGAKYPHPQTDKMIAGLQMFLDACRERIEDRMGRGVMGELKK